MQAGKTLASSTAPANPSAGNTHARGVLVAGGPSYVPGITWASLAASLLGLLLMSMVVQYGEVILAAPGAMGEHTLAFPAIWVALVLVVVVGIIYTLSRFSLLTRAELLCVVYAMLIGAPLMSQGFWHRIVAITATIPRSTDQFDKIDAFNDRLWPHGPNVLAGLLEQGSSARVVAKGTVRWEPVEYEAGQTASLPVLVNTAADQVATVRLRVPVLEGDRRVLAAGEPYLVSVLVRARDLGPDTKYFARLYVDGAAESMELLRSNAGEKVTILHKRGFQRVGTANVKLPKGLRDYVEIELGLAGPGRLEVADPKMLNVAALEDFYNGKGIIGEAEFNKLPPLERVGLIVKPARMWSWAGLKFVLTAYIPVRDWVMPGLVWGTFVGLLFLTFLASNVIMRRQWMDAERYQLPMARVPQALLGPEVGAEGWSGMWGSGLMWAGLAVGLLWGVWHFLALANPSMTDPAIGMDLKAYFNSPWFGKMFEGVKFEISIILLAMCLFMELNILASLVLGYWLYHAQWWVGHINGWTTQPEFPYRYEQTLGSYLAYAAVIGVLSWRYLWEVLKAALTNNRRIAAGELFSYRTAVLLLLAAFAGAALWGWSVGISVIGMLLFFGCLSAVGLVAAKLRTECGIALSYFVPYNLALFATLVGGMGVLGPQAVLFCYIACFFLATGGLFLVAGGQLELIELGRRWRVKPSHLVLTIALALVGGLFLGGWTFLSNGYAMGGNQIRYNWAFDTKAWYLGSYNSQLQQATNQFLGDSKGVSAGMDPAWYGYGFGAVVTVLLTVLRQIFAGFWFHPAGFILGSTFFGDMVWGSVAGAWVVRRVVLWIGGAATVRNKLQPFAVGLFLGGILAELIALISRAGGYPPLLNG